MRNLFILSVLFLIAFSCNKKTEINEWRGENRTGIYPETNLLKAWPEDGPEMLWFYEGIGNGYGSPAITSEKIFVNGEVDSLSHLFAFDLQGKLLWESEYDSSWVVNFPGSRSTPTVVDDLVYVCSPKGEVVCFKSEDGSKVWSLNMIEKYNGVITRFGFAQSLLVDGDKVFFAPGDSLKTNVVAVNRFTGEEVWTSLAKAEKPAFCSPMMVNLPTRKLLVTFSEFHLFGLDAETGRLLWSVEDSVADIKGNTPVYENGYLYATSYGNGTVKLKLSEDGSEVTEVWRNKKINSIQEGLIKVNNKLIGTHYKKFHLKVIDENSGEVIDSIKTGNGSVIYADEMLYFYNEKGPMNLLKLNPKLELVSKFRIKKGKKEHFAHPAIKDGVLYVRHGNVLMAYDIRKKTS
jgi:outer membrane protein assembly factor BamB